MSWRMKLALLIAGKELDAWNSKHNRIVSKMMQGYTEARIINSLEQHKQTTKSVSGFLGVCSCGEAIDDYNEHLKEHIKGEDNG